MRTLQEENVEPIRIKNSDYRYDSFDNSKVLSFTRTVKTLPAMGWNSWNAFGSANTEQLTKEIADSIIRLELDKLGYKYVILDDGCYKPSRIDGMLSNEPEKFPSGFKSLGDYIHSRDLKFGMYNDIGTNLCAGAAVGTCGHEEQDARSYTEWGVDFLKVDNCYYPWDNATFSDARNAKYVYAPRIKKIRISGQNVSKEFDAAEDGILKGNGAKVESDYVTGIGTFDGTGPDQTPVGLESSELNFEISCSRDEGCSLYVTYASGEESGFGQWLQLAVDNEIFYDDFLPATTDGVSFAESKEIRIQLKQGKNVIRLMNHRRQENTLASYAKLLEEIYKLNPQNNLTFSLCEWGKTQPQNWGYKVGNSWRILNDITFEVGSPQKEGNAKWEDSYTTSITTQYNKAVIMDEFAGIYKGWNDPDMLVIGMNGITEEMCRTHFAMWCMMNSPLMLGLDLRKVNKGDWIYNIIANRKLIDLNQDILGVQAKRIKSLSGNGTDYIELENPSTTYTRNNERMDILAKPLYDGSIAVSFINLSRTQTFSNTKVSMKELMSCISRKMPVRPDYINAEEIIVEDLWNDTSNEVQWKLEDKLDGISIECKELKPCSNYTVRISVTKSLEKKAVAVTVHEYLLNTLGESDEENYDAAKELVDLYDCRLCVNHIAQVYTKGIMDATDPAEKIFGVNTVLGDNEIRIITERIFDRSRRASVR